MGIVSTPDMQRTHAEWLRNGRITPSALDYARRQGYDEETLAAIIGRVKEKRASLAVQGNPLAHRRSTEPEKIYDPTVQRKRDAGSSLGEIAIKAAGAASRVIKQFKIKNPIEQHAYRFPMHLRCALERFVSNYDRATRINVLDLNRSSGGTTSSRLGGLGGVPNFIRDADEEHEWVRNRLSPEMHRVAQALLSRELLKPDGTPFDLEDFGADMFPSVIDKNRRWGISIGALYILGGHLAAMYQSCPIVARNRTRRAKFKAVV